MRSTIVLKPYMVMIQEIESHLEKINIAIYF